MLEKSRFAVALISDENYANIWLDTFVNKAVGEFRVALISDGNYFVNSGWRISFDLKSVVMTKGRVKKEPPMFAMITHKVPLAIFIW